LRPVLAARLTEKELHTAAKNPVSRLLCKVEVLFLCSSILCWGQCDE